MTKQVHKTTTTTKDEESVIIEFSFFNTKVMSQSTIVLHVCQHFTPITAEVKNSPNNFLSNIQFYTRNSISSEQLISMKSIFFYNHVYIPIYFFIQNNCPLTE